MRLRLGTYSLKIKSYTAHELGLEHIPENLIFNIYQKVFHFWYIPISPVEKHWKIVDGTTKKEVGETSAAMRSAIDLKILKKRSPIWSYSGLLIVVLPILLVLGYVIYGAIDVSMGEINKARAKNLRISNKEKLAKIPEIGDLYTFKILSVERVTDMNGQSAGYKPSYFSSPYGVDYSVNYISRDSIGFGHNDIEGRSNYTYGMKRQFKLSKNDVLLAVKNYQELNILRYPNEEGSKTKKIVGIFQIERQP